MKQSVLILGSNGKIGSHSSNVFKKAGWAVKHYQRGTNMVDAAKGVNVIVNGLNPPNYHNWKKLIPIITNQVIEAAKLSGATVIIPGNIYNFGMQPGILDENTPQIPNSRKGRIRLEMEEAYANSPIQTIILRAGFFIDPAGNGDYMSLLALRNISKGKVMTTGDPDTKQAYAYMPDWARAAEQLAGMRQQLAKFEDIPFPGHNFTTNELLAKIRTSTGYPIQLSYFPWFLMTLCSPFWELAREMREMRYLYSMPHEIGEKKFKRLLPHFQPTSLEEVMLCGIPENIEMD